MDWYPLKRAITRYNISLVKTHDKIGTDLGLVPHNMLVYATGDCLKILVQDNVSQREIVLEDIGGCAVVVQPVRFQIDRKCSWHALISEFGHQEARIRLQLGIEKSWWRRRFFGAGKIVMYHSGWTLEASSETFYQMKAYVAGVRTLAPF